MKRVIAVLLAAALVFGLTACTSGPKPEDTIKAFCEGMKAYDFSAMSACMEGVFDQTPVDEWAGEYDGIVNYMKSCAAGMTYKIGTPTVTGDTAAATVEMEYTDIAPVIGETFKDLFIQLFSSIFADMSEEEEMEMLTKILDEKIASVETGRKTASIDMILKQVDGEWKIAELPDDIYTVLCCNAEAGLDSLENLFSGEGYEAEDLSVDFPMGETVLFEAEDARMTIKKAGLDTFGDIYFDVLCENFSDKDLTFDVDHMVINGWTVSSWVSVEVAAGKSSNTTINVWDTAIQMLGIESPDRVSIALSLYETDLWYEDERLYEDMVTIYPTGLSEDQIVDAAAPEATNPLVVDTDDFSYTILGCNENSSWGYALLAVVENKTDKPLGFSMDKVSIDGFMVDPYWGATINAGEKSLSEISFSSDDLEANGIETPQEISFALSVHDEETWDTIYEESFVYEAE